jgi:RNA polymerase sigma factor (sigma-70 family)
MEAPQDFQVIVREAQQGSRDAMDRLLAILRPQLEELSRGYADPARAAESTQDLVQEAWLRAWQKMEQFKGGRDDAETMAMFRGWIGQIVHRLGLNAIRDRQVQRRSPPAGTVQPLRESGPGSSGGGWWNEPAAGGPSPSGVFQIDEEARLVQAALEKISDTIDRDIVRLRFFEGVSLRQIAERLGMRYSAVRERYQVSLRVLERELEDFI